MPPYRRGGADSRGASARSGGPGTRRSSEFVILRSPENITDVDPDTEDDWDREYRPQIKKIGKPAKKVTRSMGPADDVESLVDLEDYSPRRPSRKRREVKGGSNSNTSTVGDQISFLKSAVSGGDSCGPPGEDSEDHDTPPPFRASKIAERSPANKEAGMARARAGTIVCTSSTGRKSATEIKSAQQKKDRRTVSYEAKTAERVAEIAAKKAPHLVALARINAEAEQLREQLRLKKQERELMEKVLGVVRSRERDKVGLERKTGKPKTTGWVADSGNEGPFEISSGSEVTRQMSLLREELQEESEGWNSLFDESEELSGVDSIKANKPTTPQSRKKVPGKSQEKSEAGEKGQEKGEKSKWWFEENTDGELAERTGSRPAARFPASDSDSLFSDLGEMQVQGGRQQFGETKKALYWPKISQQEKKGLSGLQSIREKEERQGYGQKRKHRLEANTDGKLAGQKYSQKTSRFPVSDSDSLSHGSGTRSGHGRRKRFKKTTGVLRGKPRKGFAIHSKRRLPYEEHLGPHDEKVASKKKVEYDKSGDVTEATDHPSDWQRLRERVGKSHQELATSKRDAIDGVGPGGIGAKHLSLQEAAGSGDSVRGAQEDLRAGRGLEHLGGEQGGGGTEDELERVNKEIDAFLGECGVSSTSLHDRQKSPEGYNVDPLDPLPEMLWESLVEVGDVGDSSIMAEGAVVDSMDKGLGPLDGELELLQKEHEKDLDFMDWDGAEAEFLRFDDADLHLTVGGPKGDVELDGVREQERGMENRAGALQPQSSPQEPLLPRDTPEESTREKDLADLEEEEIGHLVGGPEDEENDTLEGDEKTKIYNPVRLHNRASGSRGRVRARPYSMKELADYSMASLFQTYKDEIEKMETKAIKLVKSSVARRGDGEMGGKRKSQGKGAGNTPGEEPRADGLPNLGRDKVYPSGAEDYRIDTLSERSGCGGNRKREREEGVRDATPSTLQPGKIAEKREAEGKIEDSTGSSLEPSWEKKESGGFVGVDVSSPEDGEIVELEREGSDSLSIFWAETPDNCMRYLGAGSSKGSFMGKIPDPDSAVFPGETAKLYRVELPDTSMGYVHAEMISGAWSMVFMTDAPGDGCGKTQRSPLQPDSDGGFLLEAGASASRIPERIPEHAPQSISEERARSDFSGAWAGGCQEECGGKGVGAAGRQSKSPPLKRAFQEPNWGHLEEGKQQKQEPSTQDRHEDNNDWD
ncbi:hypothetical protein B9Z19DRAFT_1062323 [Tuber borchii]|uniref:Uncharacterized protein n=1 Tax=Tuber borchii TaxID=42251 RepID=A0A2T7A267_TUBBO|nr:hypothetical protein B9Z19DRAFT_1062323 [Tuber borchii]